MPRAIQAHRSGSIKARYSRGMERRGQGVDRYGKTWTATIVSKDEAEAEDFRFWYEELSPEDRVAAVEDCLLSSLKAQGIDEIPRIRRVSRVVKRARG